MTRIFLPLALLVSGLSLWQPYVFIETKPLIPYLLGMIMFCMGITLTLSDFVGVAKRWRLVSLGILGQFTIMPLLALGISLSLKLPKELIAGFVLLGACPGGTASNVVVYLARGNVALSVSMTLVSTALAPVLTPWVTYLLAGQKVDIDPVAMMNTIVMIVAFPLILGLLVRLCFSNFAKAILPGLPLFTIIVIVWVIGIVMALNEGRIMTFPGKVILGVVLHNLLGVVLGYAVASGFTKDKADRRTLAIEVGMQNSGLAVALASKFLPAASALPAALFSLWHNLSGAALATFFGGSKRDSR